jgi:hypothetical protein
MLVNDNIPLLLVDYKDWPIAPLWLNVNDFSLNSIVTTAMFIDGNWKTILHHVGSDKQCYYIHAQRRGMGGAALRAFM